MAKTVGQNFIGGCFAVNVLLLARIVVSSSTRIGIRNHVVCSVYVCMYVHWPRKFADLPKVASCGGLLLRSSARKLTSF